MGVRLLKTSPRIALRTAYRMRFAKPGCNVGSPPMNWTSRATMAVNSSIQATAGRNGIARIYGSYGCQGPVSSQQWPLG